MTNKMVEEGGNADPNFFAGLMEWDAIKITFTIWHLLVSILGPALLYTFIAYEKHSGDFRYRTVINQILSHCCWIEIVACTLGRTAFMSFFVIGPLDSNLCHAILSFGRVLYLAVIMEVTLRQLIKYLYIFQWRHIVGINDDFFATFLTTANVGLSSMVEFVSFRLGSHLRELDFHFCSGASPDRNFNATQKLTGLEPETLRKLVDSDPVFAVSNASLLILAALSAQIWFYSHYDDIKNRLKTIFRGPFCHVNRVSTVNRNLQPTLSEEKFRETKNQILGTGQIFLVILVSIAVLMLNYHCKTILSENISSINTGWNRTLQYLNKMGLPTFTFVLVPALILMRNDKIKAFVIKEAREKLGWPLNKVSTEVTIEITE